MLCFVVEWPGGRRIAPVPERGCRVGSSPDNDLVIDAAYVSRHHAVLRRVGDQVEIRDLSSRNGTLVDGRLVDVLAFTPPVVVALGPDVRGLVAEADSDEVLLHPAVAAHRAGAPGEEAGRTASSPATPSDRDVRLPRELLAALARVGGSSPWPRLAAALRAAGFEDVEILRLPESGEPCVLEGGARHGRDERILAALREALAGGVRWSRLPLGAASDGGCFAATAGPVGRVVVLARDTCSPPGDALSAIADALDAAEALAAGRRATGQAALLARAEAAPPEPSIAEPSASPAMREVHVRIAAMAVSDLPVLLTGETGVGKEVHARALHGLSPRRAGPLRAINSSAIPEQLLESLLFGTEEGVATGVRKQKGLLREADGGTFFFDEIGDMSPSLQAKLLRVLDERAVLPLGGKAPVPIDVRFVAATHCDLRELIREGRFRQDLYQRLRGHELRLPSLRDRREDIPALVNAFLVDEAARAGRPVPGVTVKAMACLIEHDWPGNVRELETLARRLVYELPADGRPIGHGDLPDDLRELAPRRDSTLEERLDELRKRLVREALGKAGGNKSHAAAALGIGRTRLRELIAKFGLAPEGDDEP